MAILGVYLTNNIRSTQIENLRSELRYQSGIISQTILPLIIDTSKAGEVQNSVKEISSLVEARITVIDITGNVLADSEDDTALMDNHSSRPEFRAAVDSGYGESTRYSTTLGYNMMYIALPVSERDIALGVIRLAIPLKDIDSISGNMRAIITIAIPAAVVFSILAAWLITRLLVKPVKQVTEAAKQIASGKLVQKIDIKSSDETGELARSFNQMSVKLSAMMETISEDRQRLAGILDNIADGVIMTDAEGRIIVANRAIGKIFRVKTPEITGRHLIESLHEHELSDILKECLESGHESVTQFESDKYKRFIRAMAIRVTGKTSKNVLFLIQDLTELRAFQTMRRELIGNISHDFRTPLAGIKAMAETLQEGAIDDRDTAQDFLKRINDEVDRLVQMVSELSELSRIETGKAELRLEPVDINKLVEETVSYLRSQIERKGLSVSIRKDEKITDMNLDRNRIRQVIINILHNAVKFTGQGGNITITTTSNENSVTVNISDTGTGISKDDLPHIFERFYMADRSRASGGTGMGLAIAKHVIEAHNGTITATSVENKGSTFSFSLPLQ